MEPFEQDGKLVKQCCRCQEIKEIEAFDRERKGQEKRRNTCRVCRKIPAPPSPYAPYLLDDIMVKRCRKCQETKSIDEFADKTTKRGYQTKESRCDTCRYQDKREYHHRIMADPDKAERKREYALEQYYKHRERTAPKRAAYTKRPEVRAKIQARQRERAATDLQFRLKRNVSALIRNVIDSNVKHGRSLELLGCSVEEFRRHIEAQFTEGMSWDLWGTDSDGISLDHILPCALFDMSDGRHQRVCFNYRNVRPMWHRDNIAKQDDLDDGRSARSLTVDERREYLTAKGYGYLFEGAPEPLPNANKLPRPSRRKPVYRDDGKRYESINEAGDDMGVRPTNISTAVKHGYWVKGHLFVMGSEVDAKTFEVALQEQRAKGRITKAEMKGAPRGIVNRQSR